MKMNPNKRKVLSGALATAVAVTLFTGYSASYAVATEISREAMKTKAASIPDKVQTVAGELEFFDGVPIGDTNDRVYDYLTRSRALGVYLDNVGAVSIYSVLAGMAEQGAGRSKQDCHLGTADGFPDACHHLQHIHDVCLCSDGSG